MRTDKAIVSSYGPHFGEEDVLVGYNGSGTIFFGYCNMKCVYCQNFELSFYGEGNLVSDAKLANIMLQLQNHYKCHNINLVTPTHFVSNILKSIYIAAQEGLKLPIVYNCGGYESIEILKILDGIIDIYMPDFKYNSPERAKKYSKVENYPEKAKLALKEMDRQVNGLKVDERGIACRGLLIRHLYTRRTGRYQKVLKFIKEELSPAVYEFNEPILSSHKAFEYEEIAKGLSFMEYQQAYDYAKELG